MKDPFYFGGNRFQTMKDPFHFDGNRFQTIVGRYCLVAFLLLFFENQCSSQFTDVAKMVY